MPSAKSVHNQPVNERRKNDRQLELWPENDVPLNTGDPFKLAQLPDVRDGLTREQRVILYALHLAEKERPGRRVSTTMLYGRVIEYMPMSKDRFQALLSHLVGRGVPGL